MGVMASSTAANSCGKRRAHVERNAGARPFEGQRLRMQEGALQAVGFEIGVARAIAVLVVAQQRMAGEGGMHADLMGAPGWNVHLHQASPANRKTAPA